MNYLIMLLLSVSFAFQAFGDFPHTSVTEFQIPLFSEILILLNMLRGFINSPTDGVSCYMYTVHTNEKCTMLISNEMFYICKSDLID